MEYQNKKQTIRNCIICGKQLMAHNVIGACTKHRENVLFPQSNARDCIRCGNHLRRDNRSGVCAAHKAEHAPKRFCEMCDRRIMANNQLGLCRDHRRDTLEGKRRERNYLLKNYQKHLENGREYSRQHRKQQSEYAARYVKQRMKIDPLFKLHKRLQEYASRALRKTGGRGYKRTVEILGADMLTVRDYIEAKFQPRMSWANYGLYGWHLDHIIPLSTATTRTELEELCRYTNLQPLWASENLKKSDRLISFPFGLRQLETV